MQLFRNSTIRRTDKRNETRMLLMVVMECSKRSKRVNCVMRIARDTYKKSDKVQKY